MNTVALHDEAWPYVLTLLPANFEETARSSHALVRARNIPNAAALLRLTLAYAVSDLSLKDVAAWGRAMDVADITGPGLFYRLREAEGWLEQMLADTLQADVQATPVGILGRVRIVDATVITGPGSKGTDWRVHAMMDPASGTLCSVEVTDAHGGENYGRYPLGSGDIVIGDRGYARARGIATVHEAGASVITRLSPASIRLCDLQQQVLNVTSLEASVPQVGCEEWSILLPVPPDTDKKSWALAHAVAWIPARLIGGRTRDGEVIWLLSTVERTELAAVEVMRLYRLRWQVELAFKRLKSLLHLDALPTRQGPTARSWLLAKLLAAALADRLTKLAESFSPWGYELPEARIRA